MGRFLYKQKDGSSDVSVIEPGNCPGEWHVLHKGQCVKVFKDADKAVKFAQKKFSVDLYKSTNW